MCKMCDERGKNWRGDDPKCAFDDNGVFVSDNWNCATMNALRNIATKYYTWNEDEYCAPVPIREEGVFVVLSWYKNRGCTYGAWLVSEGKIETLTCTRAVECINSHDVVM